MTQYTWQSGVTDNDQYYHLEQAEKSENKFVKIYWRASEEAKATGFKTPKKETCRGKPNCWRSSSPLEQRMGAFANLNTQQEVENMGFAWAKDSWFRVENPGGGKWLLGWKIKD